MVQTLTNTDITTKNMTINASNVSKLGEKIAFKLYGITPKPKPTVNDLHHLAINEMIRKGIIDKNSVEEVKRKRYRTIICSEKDIEMQEQAHRDRYYSSMWEPEFIPTESYTRRVIKEPTCYKC